MAITPIHFNETAEAFPPLVVSDSVTMLKLISEEIDTHDSRDKFDNYFALRRSLETEARPQGQKLESIQEDVAQWLEVEGFFKEKPNYAQYDKTLIQKKLGGLTQFLHNHYEGVVTELELEITDAFVDSTFAMYESKSGDYTVSPDADGSFAFIVPARVSRKNNEYGEEVESVIPALRYVPNNLRADMMVGLPPFIIDVYERNKHGRRGYLVFAPVSGDITDDLELRDRLKVARKNINDTVDFAQERLGVEIVGLGATLPSLTRFGKKVTNPNVIVTTGHGGTTRLITETIHGAYEQGLVRTDAVRKIGFIGLGSIGASVAELVTEEFPDAHIIVYDTDSSKIAKTVKKLYKEDRCITAAVDAAQLINQSDVIISAVTKRIDLNENSVSDMTGKIIIDDSQPASFDPGQVQRLNGNMTWVIGHDTQGVVVRENYDYGTLNDAKHDVFGCEAEAAVISHYSEELAERGMPKIARERILARIALRNSVTPEKARLIGGLFKKYGIRLSNFQVFGELTALNK